MANRALAAGAGAAVAQLTHTAARRRAGARWERINHRGRALTLVEGPALAAGAAAAVALTPGLPPRARVAGVLAIAGAGAVGAYDDLGGLRTQQAKGFRGHLAALRAGRVTSGSVKAAGIGATSLAAAALLPRPVDARPADGAGLGNALLGGAVIAGFANLVNLFDLRPGRAIKVGLLHAPLIALPGPTGAFVAGPLGAAAALLPADLREEAMLGDAGANALGAALGTAVLLKYGTRGRLAHVLGIAALTAASEKVSFTQVIAATPPLRWLDELGRTLPPRSPESAP